MSRKLVLGFLVVALAVYALLSRQNAPPSGETASSEETRSARDHGFQTTEEDALPPLRSTGPQSRTARADHPLAHLTLTSTFSELYPGLLTKARRGDKLAAVAIKDLITRCRQFWPQQGRTYDPRTEADAAQSGSPEHAARMHAARLLEAHCDQALTDAEAARVREEMKLVIADDLESQREIAQADSFFRGASEGDMIAALGSSNPWVAETAALALSGSSSPRIREMERRVFSDSLLTPGEIQKIKGNAARWLGCELGAPCGQNQYSEVADCLYLGNCGLGLDTRTFIRQRVLSAREFELMQAYLRELDQLRPSRNLNTHRAAPDC